MSLISNFLKSKDSVHAKPYVYWNTLPHWKHWNIPPISLIVFLYLILCP